MVKSFALNFYMRIKWTNGRNIQITTIFKFLNYFSVFTQSKAHLTDGIDIECTFQIQTSNSLSTSAQSLWRMNTGFWVISTNVILLALNTRISYEWLLQNLRKKYVSKFVGWNLSDGRNAQEHSTFINPTNSAF